MSGSLHIRSFELSDTESVVALWTDCGLTRPWNDPRQDITRKLATQPELFLVGDVDGALMSTAMVGFDGHRGWIYYLAVAPAHRRQGHARALISRAERDLVELGCPKIMLMVRQDNFAVIDFYRGLDYELETTVVVGKRLISDL